MISITNALCLYLIATINEPTKLPLTTTIFFYSSEVTKVEDNAI